MKPEFWDDIPIKESNLELYARLEQDREKAHRSKNRFFLLALIVTLFLILQGLFPNTDEIIFTGFIEHFIFYFIVFCLSYVLYYFTIRRIRFQYFKDIHNVRDENNWNIIIKQLIKFVPSPDLYVSKLYKDKIISSFGESASKDHFKDIYDKGLDLHTWDTIKIKNKYFLILSNWMNVKVSIMLVLISLVILEINLGDRGNLLISFFDWFVISFLIIRVISRTVEIISAFYKDVVEKNDKIFSKDTKPDLVTGLEVIGKKKSKRLYYIHNWKNSYLLKGDAYP